MNTSENKHLQKSPSLSRLLAVLTATYRTEAPPDALKSAWQVGLEGLSRDEVETGLRLTLQEHKFGFMPTPGEFRERALRRTEGWRGLGQRVDLTRSEFTTDEAGRTVIARLDVRTPEPLKALTDPDSVERAKLARDRFFETMSGKGAGKGNIAWDSLLGAKNEETA